MQNRVHDIVTKTLVIFNLFNNLRYVAVLKQWMLQLLANNLLVLEARFRRPRMRMLLTISDMVM